MDWRKVQRKALLDQYPRLEANAGLGVQVVSLIFRRSFVFALGLALVACGSIQSKEEAQARAQARVVEFVQTEYPGQRTDILLTESQALDDGQGWLFVYKVDAPLAVYLYSIFVYLDGSIEVGKAEF